MKKSKLFIIILSVITVVLVACGTLYYNARKSFVEDFKIDSDIVHNHSYEVKMYRYKTPLLREGVAQAELNELEYEEFLDAVRHSEIYYNKDFNFTDIPLQDHFNLERFSVKYNEKSILFCGVNTAKYFFKSTDRQYTILVTPNNDIYDVYFFEYW